MGCSVFFYKSESPGQIDLPAGLGLRFHLGNGFRGLTKAGDVVHGNCADVCHGRRFAGRDVFGNVVFEYTCSLIEAGLFEGSVGLKLVLGLLATFGGEFDDFLYERWVVGMCKPATTKFKCFNEIILNVFVESSKQI